MAELDPSHITAAVHTRAPKWENAGARWSLTIGSARDGVIASITGEIGQVFVHLVVKTGGEAEINVVDQPAKLSSRYHYRVATADDIAVCLDEFTHQIVSAG